MRVNIRTSRWAIWARRLASFAIPLLVFSVVLHRGQIISSEIFTILLCCVFVLAGLTILATCVSFVRLWNTGDKGWGRTFQAFFLGLLLIAPLCLAIVFINQTPYVNDVTTVGETVPELYFISNPNSATVSTSEVIANWPNAVSRTYPVEVDLLFELVKTAVADQGWEVWRRRDAVEGVSSAQVNAISTSWLGWRDEVGISVSADVDGATINMRSASFWGLHDLGSNGRRMETFLTKLDESVSDVILTQNAASSVEGAAAQ